MPGTERQLTLRFLAEPADVNFGGKVHGGAVMKWIDLAAYACAAAWSGKYCITVYAGGIRFIQPIQVGHIVETIAKIIYTGRSSMHLVVDVRSGDPKTNEREITTHSIIIMVAVDDEGKPTQVPEWRPQSEVDIDQRQSAIKLMAMRKQIDIEMDSHIRHNKLL